FSGGASGVKDNEGKTAIAAGQSLGDAAILGMNWLVEGVLSKLPR
nr:BMP family ABC transporter substrate-binding protein [Hydrogenophaga sp.]